MIQHKIFTALESSFQVYCKDGGSCGWLEKKVLEERLPPQGGGSPKGGIGTKPRKKFHSRNWGSYWRLTVVSSTSCSGVSMGQGLSHREDPGGAASQDLFQAVAPS